MPDVDPALVAAIDQLDAEFTCNVAIPMRLPMPIYVRAAYTMGPCGAFADVTMLASCCGHLSYYCQGHFDDLMVRWARASADQRLVCPMCLATDMDLTTTTLRSNYP